MWFGSKSFGKAVWSGNFKRVSGRSRMSYELFVGVFEYVKINHRGKGV